jgi:hypothetical protein
LELRNKGSFDFVRLAPHYAQDDSLKKLLPPEENLIGGCFEAPSLRDSLSFVLMFPTLTCGASLWRRATGHLLQLCRLLRTRLP